MNCKEAKRLIHASSIGEIGTADTDALERHTEKCPLCRSEIALLQMLESELTNLAEIRPPAELQARILAAVANLDEPRGDVQVNRDELVEVPLRDSLGWTLFAGGGVFLLSCYVYNVLTGEIPLNLTGSRIGGLEGLAVPHGFGALTVAYLMGLLLVLSGGGLLQQR